MTDRRISDAVPAQHCLVCQSATPAQGDALLARAMTVETSKLYAALHFRAELDAR
jgi:hypothetical protein